MSEEKKPVKGRKFIALQEGLCFSVLFIIGCIIEPKLVALAPFAMIAIGLVATYMGTNAVKGIKK